NSLYLLFYFFFQAEDGIRDFHVTGVQTCALPICLLVAPAAWVDRNVRVTAISAKPDVTFVINTCPRITDGRDRNVVLGRAAKLRSEERRVGKECSNRWRSYHLIKEICKIESYIT